MLMNYVFTLLFIICCIFLYIILLAKLKQKRKAKEKIEKVFQSLDSYFDDILYQTYKGNTIENLQRNIRHEEFQKFKEWKSRFGYEFNIYSNDHFIDGKPHFHLDNKSEGVSCKMSFQGEVFECAGKDFSSKISKELNYFLSNTNVQTALKEMWNFKNPILKLK